MESGVGKAECDERRRNEVSIGWQQTQALLDTAESDQRGWDKKW